MLTTLSGQWQPRHGFRAALRNRSAHGCSRAAKLHVRAEAASSSQPQLVVVGSLNADTVLEVDRIPKGGETMNAKTLKTFPGGKAPNQAAAAGKVGYPTVMLGQVGTDVNADLLRSSLEEASVDVSHLRAVEGPTGSAIILLQPSGENSIMIVGGANKAEWSFSEEAQEVLNSAGGLLLQREIPEELNIKVAKIVADKGKPVILDCGGGEDPISEQLLQHLTVLSPNETELARLSGQPTESEQEIEAAVHKLQGKGVQQVLVKLGQQGSVLYGAADEPIRQGIFKVDKVVDTTGAGDTFTAAYAVALLEGNSQQDCLRFAAAAAALCVQRPGAMPSSPLRDEVEQLLKSES
ncbi:hypothetical protein WJX73_002988 [Symbiochloris irregularis]|uniref:Ribokinase n=1 Tax=Symbiochloris irregularis TaxID=706552 RepID=A0AAW1NRT2_9CHLO